MESRYRTHRMVVCVAVLWVAFLAIAGLPAQAQEPEKTNSEVQQLREKLLKLEQTVQELKVQLANLEQPRIAPVTAKIVQPETAKPAQPESAKAVKPETHPAPTPTATTANRAQEPKKGESTFEVY